MRYLPAPERVNCDGCGAELNPIRFPREYETDLDARDVAGCEYCYPCYENEQTFFCEICREEFFDESLCRHLFFDYRYEEIAGPGAVWENEQSDRGYVEKYVKPGFKRFIRAVADAEVENARYVATGEARTGVILQQLEKMAYYLERDNFVFGTRGTIFSTDTMIFENVENDADADGYLLMQVSTRRFYDDQAATRDGGSWLRCLGGPDTHLWNALAAQWIRECVVPIWKAHRRYHAGRARRAQNA